MKLTSEQIAAIAKRMSLSPAQAVQLKSELSAFSDKADQAADSMLTKIGNSKYTWLIIIGILATVWALGYIQH